MLNLGTRNDLLETCRENKCSLDDGRKIMMTDAMISASVQVDMHINNNELLEAVQLQNELIVALITETRKLS